MNVFKRYPIQRKPEKRYDANSLSIEYEQWLLIGLKYYQVGYW